MRYTSIYNNQSISLNDIPELGYTEFLNVNCGLLSENPQRHCVNFFGYKTGEVVRLLCCIADDTTHQIYLSSSIIEPDSSLPSFTAQNHNFEKFEREIHENFGIKYSDHPW